MNARKLLTIVTEAAIEALLIRDVERLGATGYTVVNARGKGSRGIRTAHWENSGNIQIDIVCDADTAERITAHLQDRYYADYAMILYTTDIQVLRPEKFQRP